MSSLSGAHHDEADADDLPPRLAAGIGPRPPSAEGRSSVADAASERAQRPDVMMLQRAKAGDRAAYGQIVVLYQDRLYNAVLRLVGDRDEALELTQEAFTRGLMKLDSFRGDASPYTWLFRIAVNLAISQLRKVQRTRTFSLDRPSGRSASGGGRYDDDQASSLVDRVAQDGQDLPPQRLERRERDGQVLEALGRLDAEYRAVLVMRDIEGFDYQQMADVLGLPLGTLKSRLFRARLALRDELRVYLKDVIEQSDARDAKRDARETNAGGRDAKDAARDAKLNQDLADLTTAQDVEDKTGSGGRADKKGMTDKGGSGKGLGGGGG